MKMIALIDKLVVVGRVKQDIKTNQKRSGGSDSGC